MLLSLLAGLTVQHGAFVLACGASEITSEELTSFANLCGGKDQRVMILEVDTPRADVPNTFASILHKAGFTDVRLENLTPLSESDKLKLVARIDKARAILFHGDVCKLFDRVERDWCNGVFSHFIQRGGIWFGYGEGASAVGTQVLDGDKTQPGIGLLDGIIATDYYTKHRELPLRNAFFGSKVELGLGLDRGDWVVIRDGNVEKKVGTPHFILREAR